MIFLTLAKIVFLHIFSEIVSQLYNLFIKTSFIYTNLSFIILI